MTSAQATEAQNPLYTQCSLYHTRIMSKKNDTRVEALFWAEIIVPEQQQTIPADMIGLSSKSIELECSTRLAINTACKVCIQLVNRKNTDLPVVCDGHISAHTHNGIIFSIDHVDDSEGLENLNNIILFHANDPHQAVRELDS